MISPFFYLTVIFSMVIDKLVWKNAISPVTLIGFVLIVVGAILLLVLYPKEDFIIKKGHEKKPHR